MSMESAKAFMERMKNDEEFRKKVNECKDAEARKALVVNEGFDFTVEEIKFFGVELSELDLSMVAAAGNCYYDQQIVCKQKDWSTNLG
jgi:predicted ribosomally synthesized peptide with nif11-like leader